MSKSLLKTELQSTAAMKAIEEVASFSSVEMFAHLFDISPTLLPAIRKIENQCQHLLRKQLRSDLLATNIDPIEEASMVEQSALEESISMILSANSAFWEQYYRRINRRTHSIQNSPPPPDIAIAEFQHQANARYPHFYLIIDIMHSVRGIEPEHYQLIQMAMQSYFKGMLLYAYGHHDESREAMGQALKLNGPLFVPEFRKLLIRSLDIA